MSEESQVKIANNVPEPHQIHFKKRTLLSRFFRSFGATLIWFYVISKIFIFDFDNWLIYNYAPYLKDFYNFKFLFILIVISVCLIIFKKGAVIWYFAFVSFFPVWVLMWKLPSLIYKHGSWTFALAFVNLISNYFRSLRYKLLITTAFCTSIIVISNSDTYKTVLTSGIILLLSTLIIYVRTIITALFSQTIFITYQKIFSFAEKFAVSGSIIDKEIEGMPLEIMNEEQRKKWFASLEITILANRGFLFIAKRLQTYKNSGFVYASGALWAFFLMLLTMISFWQINYGLFRVSPSSFVVQGQPNSFLFFYYSVKTFFYGSINEIVPSDTLSRSLSIIENLLALLIVAIVLSIIIAYQSQRYANDLSDAIRTAEKSGRQIEAYIAQKYKFASVDDALVELDRLKTSLVQLLLKMTG